MKMAASKKNLAAMTLVELMVALVVTSIILSSLVSFAYALSSADDSSDDTSRKQAQIRCATLRIAELIRNCKLICYTGAGDIAIWKADSNSNGKINAGELAYLNVSSDGTAVRLLEFTPTVWQATQEILLANIKTGLAKTTLTGSYSPRYTSLLAECRNIRFRFDADAVATKFITILFDISEDNQYSTYQIAAAMECRSQNFVDSSGTTIVTDDD